MPTIRHITALMLLLCCSAGSGLSQTSGRAVSIRQVLQWVEENNKELQANRQQTTARKLEAKAGNNLPDPSVSYSHQYGNRGDLGFQDELIASQSFDFPTLYAQRSKLSKVAAEGLDYQQASLRRQLLLETEEVCLDLILLNRRGELLAERNENAGRLAQFYARRLAEGDANILETNKIDLELLNVRTEVRRNEAAILQKQSELASLNGGIPVDFTLTCYGQAEELPPFAELWNEKTAADPQLLALQSEQNVSRRQIRVKQSQWLPGLELGYRLNTATGGERFNGFLVGVSIPLFSNRHQVEKAKAEALRTDLLYEDVRLRMRGELDRQYRQSASLRASLDEYNRILGDRKALTLLNKALEAGQISMIEYFVEVSGYYDSMENRMQVEHEYRKTIAGLLSHRL